MSISPDPVPPVTADGIPGRDPRPDPAALAFANAAWQVLATAGVVAVVVGILVLVWPHATLLVVGILFGIYLIVTGVSHLVAAFGDHVPGTMRAVHFISGALCVLFGLVCFRGATESVFLLGLWIGFGWLVQGLALTMVAASTPELPARGWQLALGLITTVGGIVLVVAPVTSLTALAVLSGIWLIVIGVIVAAHAFQLRTLVKP